ncbi:hypothetical protein CSIM01_04398 [Colletotrichum simmondsii]|uniref:Uncharacterized protein n=1 Tax=Colletotrichum simmondsii TaxID=703756 RepID=A0A135T7H3_9PEZI|nr:hypothetical protein CSIM01_04398 [Colletotrichum simmondsii]
MLNLPNINSSFLNVNHQLNKQELVSQLDGQIRDLVSIAHNNSEEPPALISNSTGKDLTKGPDLKDRVRTVIADAAMKARRRKQRVDSADIGLQPEPEVRHYARVGRV